MKECKWCGKAFEAVPPCKKYCCDECRKAGVKEVKKIYKREHPEKVKTYYKRKISYCKICGVELPHGKQQYCLDCVLKDYIKAKEENRKTHEHLVTAYARLSCRGYDKEMIEYEIEQRGYDL